MHEYLHINQSLAMSNRVSGIRTWILKTAETDAHNWQIGADNSENYTLETAQRLANSRKLARNSATPDKAYRDRTAWLG
jgi:hypothetical protein